MALRNGSSQTIGLVDVATNIVGFEVINGVRIVLTMTVGDLRGQATVMIGARAEERAPESPDPKVLGSVSVNTLATNLLTLDAALIHVLYMLDGEIARRAMLEK